MAIGISTVSNGYYHFGFHLTVLCRSGLVYAVKLYPAGATTNSSNGVTIIEGVYPVLRTMAELG